MPPTPDAPERALISTGAVAARLGVSVKTVTNYVARGQLAAYRLPSGAFRFDRADVDALLKPIDPSEVTPTYDLGNTRTKARREP